MLSLRTCLKDVANAVKVLKGISNSYYRTSVSGKTGNYKTTFVLCSIENLPKGIYLIFGNVVGNVDAASSLLNADFSTDSNGEILINAQGRSTLNAGGGCHAWGLLEVTGASGSITLRTYRYYSGSISYTGKLAAIKLI